MKDSILNPFFHKLMSRFEQKKFNFMGAEKNGKEFFKDIVVEQHDNNILIIFGENASGKSLFSNVVEQSAREEKIEIRNACMRNRTSGGISRAFVFGDESCQSTGETSFNVARKALESTLKANKAAIAILDEPDVGLSDYYAPAMGKYIAESYLKMNENQGIVLVSHSRLLIKSFLTTLNSPVNTIGINIKSDLDTWIKDKSEASVEELLNLSSYAKDKEMAIYREIEKAKKGKS
jgi:energy-coupling factor transporter ATP-binding protein EcfA2